MSLRACPSDFAIPFVAIVCIKHFPDLKVYRRFPGTEKKRRSKGDLYFGLSVICRKHRINRTEALRTTRSAWQ